MMAKRRQPTLSRVASVATTAIVVLAPGKAAASPANESRSAKGSPGRGEPPNSLSCSRIQDQKAPPRFHGAAEGIDGHQGAYRRPSGSIQEALPRPPFKAPALAPVPAPEFPKEKLWSAATTAWRPSAR